MNLFYAAEATPNMFFIELTGCLILVKFQAFQLL
jgi:hypothetical protein